MDEMLDMLINGFMDSLNGKTLGLSIYDFSVKKERKWLFWVNRTYTLTGGIIVFNVDSNPRNFELVITNPQMSDWYMAGERLYAGFEKLEANDVQTKSL